MKASEVIALIERTAPLQAAAEWDNSGVQIASANSEISRLAVMLDPRLEDILTSLQKGADFILTHHPLLRTPRFPNVVDEYTQILAGVFSAGAWLYSAHTSLDANPEGPVQWLAGELNLSNVRILAPNLPGRGDRDCMASSGPYGFGFVGDLPEALPYDQFKRLCAGILPIKGWTGCGLQPGQVRRVACCPGSGSDLIDEARLAVADVFITGDVKYHAALDASDQLPRMLDVGHFSLEEEMIRRFADQLAGELSIPVLFYPGTPPLNYETLS